MEIIKNGFVKQNGCYNESGGLVIGTQRIDASHMNIYWQQANIEKTMGINVNELKDVIHIKEAIWIGGISQHFGHFLMEGLPRLCDVSDIKIPIIGFVRKGVLPDHIIPAAKKEIMWVIKAVTKQPFYQMKDGDIYSVETLLIPTLPYHLSHSCSEPWRMSNIIKKIVDKANLENPNIKDIDKLYLKRYEDVFDENTEYTLSDPTTSFSKQIAIVSKANKLYGKTGSNSHISIFGKSNAHTYWIPRDSYQDSDRNQLICDLIKTYNKF